MILRYRGVGFLALKDEASQPRCKVALHKNEGLNIIFVT